MRLGNGKTQGDISASHSPATALWGRLGRQLSIWMRCLSVCLCNLCTSLECSICRNLYMCIGEFRCPWPQCWSCCWKTKTNQRKHIKCAPAASVFTTESGLVLPFLCKGSTGSREEVDQAGVTGFTSYLHAAEGNHLGLNYLCLTHYIFTQAVRPTLSAKYQVAVV